MVFLWCGLMLTWLHEKPGKYANVWISYLGIGDALGFQIFLMLIIMLSVKIFFNYTS